MAQFCRQCGTKNEDNKKFCYSCGNSLTNAPKPTPVTSPLTNNTLEITSNAAPETLAPIRKPISPEPTPEVITDSNFTQKTAERKATEKRLKKKIAADIPSGFDKASKNGSSSNLGSSSGSSSAALKDSNPRVKQYLYIAGALVAAIITGGGIYWSQKPKVNEPIITMADVNVPSESAKKPTESSSTSQEVKPPVPETLIEKEASSPVEQSKVIAPTAITPKEASKEDVTPESTTIPKKAKPKKVKKVLNDHNTVTPPKHEPSQQAKNEAPVAHDTSTATKTVKPTEEKESKGLFDKLIRDVQKGTAPECSPAQRSMNQCN